MNDRESFESATPVTVAHEEPPEDGAAILVKLNAWEAIACAVGDAESVFEIMALKERLGLADWPGAKEQRR